MTIAGFTGRFLDEDFVRALGPNSAAEESLDVLMFSGGRDSTLAAVRLWQQGRRPVLVTITSSHLMGIDRVRQRLKELAPILAPGTPWLQLRQPTELKTDVSFYDQTCLPCHHAYVTAGASVAAKINAKAVAFGYVAYQSDWPEQTPHAIGALRQVLARHGINLLLPVYDVRSREEVVEELESHGLSATALEQKCLRQITNVKLDPERLNEQVALWEDAIDASISKLDQIEIEVIEAERLGAG